MAQRQGGAPPGSSLARLLGASASPAARSPPKPAAVALTPAPTPAAAAASTPVDSATVAPAAALLRPAALAVPPETPAAVAAASAVIAASASPSRLALLRPVDAGTPPRGSGGGGGASGADGPLVTVLGGGAGSQALDVAASTTARPVAALAQTRPLAAAVTPVHHAGAQAASSARYVACAVATGAVSAIRIVSHADNLLRTAVRGHAAPITDLAWHPRASWPRRGTADALPADILASVDAEGRLLVTAVHPSSPDTGAGVTATQVAEVRLHPSRRSLPELALGRERTALQAVGAVEVGGDDAVRRAARPAHVVGVLRRQHGGAAQRNVGHLRHQRVREAVQRQRPQVVNRARAGHAAESVQDGAGGVGGERVQVARRRAARLCIACGRARGERRDATPCSRNQRSRARRLRGRGRRNPAADTPGMS